MNKIILGIIAIAIIAILFMSIFSNAQYPFSIFSHSYGQNNHMEINVFTNNQSLYFYGLFYTASNISLSGNIIWLSIISLNDSGKITEIHSSYSGSVGQDYFLYPFYNQSLSNSYFENNTYVYTFNTTNNMVKYEIIAMPYKESTTGIFFQNVSLYQIANYLLQQEYQGYYPGWSGYYNFFSIFNQMLTENETSYSIIQNGSFFNTGSGVLNVNAYNVNINSTYNIYFQDSNSGIYKVSIYHVIPLYYVSYSGLSFNQNMTLIENITISSNTQVNLPSGQYAIRIYNGNNITWINVTLNHDIIINLNSFFYGNTNLVYFSISLIILLSITSWIYWKTESIYPSLLLFDFGYLSLYLIKMPYFTLPWLMALLFFEIFIILGRQLIFDEIYQEVKYR